MISGIHLTLLLVAIASVESGSNPAAIGKQGERSQYQITEHVWKSLTKEPFHFATDDKVLAEEVATNHLIQLTRELEAGKVPVTVENLALAWHAGSPAVVHHRLTAEQKAQKTV